MPQYEVTLYGLNKDGKKEVTCSYMIEQNDLQRTLNELEQDVRDGTICDFEIARV